MSAQDVGEVIGALLREARKARGLSQAELARRLGWNRPKVTLIEAGSQHLLVRDLADVAAVLGVRPADLLPPRWRP